MQSMIIEDLSNEQMEEFNSNKEKYYEHGKTYWDNAQPTISGVLQGHTQVLENDITESTKLLKTCLADTSLAISNLYALDCGAGIGRVTKYLLVPLFDNVDMVEQSEHFCNSAKQFVSNDKLRDVFCSGLQDFQPPTARYDVIWIQWVLGHLTDEDLVSFFTRCHDALRLPTNGLVFIKENVTNEPEIDPEDGCLSRTQGQYEDLFRMANLKILKVVKQKKYPKQLYPVKTFVCKFT